MRSLEIVLFTGFAGENDRHWGQLEVLVIAVDEILVLTPGPSKVGDIDAYDSQDPIRHIVGQHAVIPIKEVAEADAHYYLTHDHADTRGNEEEAASQTIDTNDGNQGRDHIHCTTAAA